MNPGHFPIRLPAQPDLGTYKRSMLPPHACPFLLRRAPLSDCPLPVLLPFFARLELTARQACPSAHDRAADCGTHARCVAARNPRASLPLPTRCKSVNVPQQEGNPAHILCFVTVRRGIGKIPRTDRGKPGGSNSMQPIQPLQAAQPAALSSVVDRRWQPRPRHPRAAEFPPARVMVAVPPWAVAETCQSRGCRGRWPGQPCPSPPDSLLPWPTPIVAVIGDTGIGQVTLLDSPIVDRRVFAGERDRRLRALDWFCCAPATDQSRHLPLLRPQGIMCP